MGVRRTEHYPTVGRTRLVRYGHSIIAGLALAKQSGQDIPLRRFPFSAFEVRVQLAAAGGGGELTPAADEPAIERNLWNGAHSGL
jgi:hypothetical protein